MTRTPTAFSCDAQPTPVMVPASALGLLVIDMQRDFLEPGGYASQLGNEVSRAAAVVPTVQAVLGGARAAGLFIAHTREGHQSDLADCSPLKRAHGGAGLRVGDAGPFGRVLVRGERGHELIRQLSPEAGELVIDKPGKGAFYATELEAELAARGITTLLVCGVTTEVCVQSTVREATDRGIACVLIEDACGSYHPDLHAATLEMIRAQHGIFGVTTTTRQLLAALSTLHPAEEATAS